MESEKKLLPAFKVVDQKTEEKTPGSTNKPKETSPQPAARPIKMPPIPDDTIDNITTQIQPRYCHTDTHTGNITLTLPADVDKYHYSIKFFDLQNKLITEVPHPGTATLIFDKKNFQRRKIIRFVLRKDGVELEEGWMTLYP